MNRTLLMAALALALAGCGKPASPSADTPAAGDAAPAPAAGPAPSATPGPSAPEDAEPERVADASGPRSLFTCRTAKGGKQIDLDIDDASVTYAFGKVGAEPEIHLVVPRAEARTWQWNGMGMAMSYSVSVYKGDIEYAVFWTAQRDPDAETPIRAGVIVFKDKGGDQGKDRLAEVLCDPDTVEQELEGVDLPADE